ncbi:MAG: glycoside hydrolase family 20 zincin-like fold domain-containing protein, partial [Pyrinomonadaceae bacterium]
MIHKILITLFFCLFVAITFGQSSEINIIPKPASIEYGTGKFVYSKTTKIVATDRGEKETARLLNDFLSKNYGFTLNVTNKRPAGNAIVFQSASKNAGNAESYTLQIDSNAVRISGSE